MLIVRPKSFQFLLYLSRKVWRVHQGLLLRKAKYEIEFQMQKEKMYENRIFYTIEESQEACLNLSYLLKSNSISTFC